MMPDVSRGARDVGHVKFSAFRCRDQAHTPIRVTQSVPHTSSLAHARSVRCGGSENTFIALIGGVLISAKAAYEDSRVYWLAGVQVRHPQLICLCLRSQGLPERRGYRLYAAR